jgi:hypothetical protein
MKLYKLDANKQTIPCSVEEWSVLTSEEKIVAKSWFGEIQVSTVFLGMDHSLGGSPILFETMIFGGEEDGFQMRYRTWEEAVRGHEEACQLADKVSIDREKKLGELGI